MKLYWRFKRGGKWTWQAVDMSSEKSLRTLEYTIENARLTKKNGLNPNIRR